MSAYEEPPLVDLQLVPNADPGEHGYDLAEHEGLEEPEGDVSALEAPDLDVFLDTEEPEYDWVVPGLFEARDRTIVTGNEGKGKSTLLRQIGLQVASGLDPFTLEPICPRRVLYIDCENSSRQLRRQLTPLRKTAADGYQTGCFRIRIAPNGIDLLQGRHQDHLLQIVAANKPELLIIGPLYKLASGDPVKEEPAREVARVLDHIRSVHDCALIIEAHSPYPTNGNTRLERPYGASLWSRWPEFGIYLAPDGRLGRWRGDREERSWPTKLTRDGGAWPWNVDTTHEQAGGDGPTHCIEASVALLQSLAPDELSTTQIVKALAERGKSYRKQTIVWALGIAVENGQLTARGGPRGSVLYRLRDDTTPSLTVVDFEEPF